MPASAPPAAAPLIAIPVPTSALAYVPPLIVTVSPLASAGLKLPPIAVLTVLLPSYARATAVPLNVVAFFVIFPVTLMLLGSA